MWVCPDAVASQQRQSQAVEASTTTEQPESPPSQTSAANGAGPATSQSANSSTRRKRRRRSNSFSQPNTAESLRHEIAWEAENIVWRTGRHEQLAYRWDSVVSWTRVVVTLTSGISAISIVGDSITVATVFAIITAAVAAVNAGFAPPETAKKHRDAARAYGHLERPLQELLVKLDSYFRIEYGVEYVPETRYDSEAGAYYDAGYYKETPRKTGKDPDEADLAPIWEAFSKLRERVETINDTAPGLSSSGPSALDSALDKRADPGTDLRELP